MVNPVPPILRDLPQTIETERLLMRAPRAGDGVNVHEAVMESLEGLLPTWVGHTLNNPHL